MSDFLDTENELILVLSAIISVICEICERHIGVSLCNRLSTLACYSPADSADVRSENVAVGGTNKLVIGQVFVYFQANHIINS